jgi:tetratricopeptide (TPR) repeat protein
MYEFLQKINPPASQDFSVGGRIAWAIYCYEAGKDAWESGNTIMALNMLREAVHSFPFPASLELLGEYLLIEGKPVEATIYLAAAVGMAEEYNFSSVFLLGKALARANDNYVSKIMLKKALSIKPDQEAEELLSEITNRAAKGDQPDGRL